MKQTNNAKKAIADMVEILKSYQLTAKQVKEVNKIAALKMPTEIDLNKLKTMESLLMSKSDTNATEKDAEKDAEKNTDTATKKEKPFRWKIPNGYEKIPVSNVKFNDITVDNNMVLYRMDKDVITNLKRKKVEYSADMTFDGAQFVDDCDLCQIISIDTDLQELTLQSVYNPKAITYINTDHFKYCVDYDNISFRILKKKA